MQRRRKKKMRKLVAGYIYEIKMHRWRQRGREIIEVAERYEAFCMAIQ